jgi:hypothetical protein
MEADMDSIANLDPLSPHLTGRLYQRVISTVFDPTKILNKSDFFFAPAVQMRFSINDCVSYSINVIYCCALFNTREQVHRLAVQRQKKSMDQIANRKILDGYSLKLFDHFVVKNRRKYSLKHDDTVVTDIDNSAWGRLLEFIEYRLIEVAANDEFLIIGTFDDEEGKGRRQASTFIRLEVGPSKAPVIIHLLSPKELVS